MIDIVALRNGVLELALRGELTEQLLSDGTADELCIKIKKDVQNKSLVKKKDADRLFSKCVYEQPHSIPDNWKWVYFGDIYSLSNGLASRGSIGGSLRPVLRLADLTNGNIETDNIRKIALTDKEFTSHLIEKDDLIFIRVNGSKDRVANVFWYNKDKEISYCDHLFCGHRYSEDILSEYILYVFNAVSTRSQIYPMIKTTAGQNTISQSHMAEVLIPLPPTEEQFRIVGVLNVLYEQIEKLNRIQNQYEEDLEIVKNKIIDAGIRGMLTESFDSCISCSKNELESLMNKKITVITKDIPFKLKKKWSWIRLEQLGQNEKNSFADGPFGSNLKKEHYTEEKEVRIIQLSNIGKNGWKDENEKYTTFEHLKTISRSETKVGDIVIAKMMPAGRAVIVPYGSIKYVLSSDCIKFVPFEKLNTKYLCYAINSSIFRKQVLKDISGIGRERTSLSKLKKYILPIPPIDEQNLIVERIENVLSLIV